MTPRENLLRAVRFERPDHIPMRFSINTSCWSTYPHSDLLDLMASHPFLFPDFDAAAFSIPRRRRGTADAVEPYTDDWGCVWETRIPGLTGAIVKHPLASWDSLEGYSPPDPDHASGIGPVNWDGVAQGVERARQNGRLVAGSLRHGHTFLTLNYIRGYENLIYDMADGEPRLDELIQMVEGFNMAVVRRYMDLGVEWMSYPEDLGMQVGPMLSPEHFRRYIRPSYHRLMAPAREAGCIIHMHSDGDIRDLVADLIDDGVQVLNLQDLVNGIDWIAENLAGNHCIELDIDRQDLTVFGTPDRIDALIREEVEKLGSKEGGLMMIHGMYPGMPLENAAALMDAMERYATYYS